MEISKATFKSRLAITFCGAIASAPVSYFVQRVLGAWGGLDPLADAFGRWLKVNLTSDQAGWSVALLVTSIAYGLLLWLVWRPVHIHHGELSATVDTKPSLSMVVSHALAHDVSLSEAALYAVTGKWGMIAGKEHFPTNEERVAAGKGVANWLPDFEQRASDGKTKVWGRHYESQSSPIVEIDALHWRTHEAYPIGVVSGQPSTRQRGSLLKDGGYSDVRVNRVEFEREWPHV